jgi:hypothetical protein
MDFESDRKKLLEIQKNRGRMKKLGTKSGKKAQRNLIKLVLNLNLKLG